MIKIIVLLFVSVVCYVLLDILRLTSLYLFEVKGKLFTVVDLFFVLVAVFWIGCLYWF